MGLNRALRLVEFYQEQATKYGIAAKTVADIIVEYEELSGNLDDIDAEAGDWTTHHLHEGKSANCHLCKAAPIVRFARGAGEGER